MMWGIETTLKGKFGEHGLHLLPQIRQVDDLASLKEILDKILNATTIEELRQMLYCAIAYIY